MRRSQSGAVKLAERSHFRVCIRFMTAACRHTGLQAAPSSKRMPFATRSNAEEFHQHTTGILRQLIMAFLHPHAPLPHQEQHTHTYPGQCLTRHSPAGEAAANVRGAGGAGGTETGVCQEGAFVGVALQQQLHPSRPCWGMLPSAGYCKLGYPATCLPLGHNRALP